MIGSRRDLDADAVIVGAGPNGLAAAVTLAREGFRVTVIEAAEEIGGGSRSRDDLTVPGLLHDVCAAVHPFGAASPFLRSLPLEEYGLTWCHPEVAVAHPLDGGSAGVAYRDLDRTAEALGADGDLWLRLLRQPTRSFDRLATDLLGPIVRVPRHPFAIARPGLTSLLPATAVAGLFQTAEARALFAGIAAHVIQPLDRPVTTAVGLMMAAAGHAHGWPVAEGGSQAIVNALAKLFTDLDGHIVTGRQIRSLRELPRCRVALLDVGPHQLVEIAGDRLPARSRRRASKWRYGPAAFKVDYAVRDGIPWTASAARKAGTVHLGGTLEQIHAAEQAVHAGQMPPDPFVLVAQQYLADPSRCVDDLVPIWAYAHVPHGYDGDATAAIDAQIERFAPGFTDRVVARHATSPAALEAYNPNNVGGDIAGGATDAWQMLARPRLAANPYATGIPGLYLCSSSTPPGAGCHGMSGYHAARSALKALLP